MVKILTPTRKNKITNHSCCYNVVQKYKKKNFKEQTLHKEVVTIDPSQKYKKLPFHACPPICCLQSHHTTKGRRNTD